MNRDQGAASEKILADLRPRLDDRDECIVTIHLMGAKIGKAFLKRAPARLVHLAKIQGQTFPARPGLQTRNAIATLERNNIIYQGRLEADHPLGHLGEDCTISFGELARNTLDPPAPIVGGSLVMYSGRVEPQGAGPSISDWSAFLDLSSALRAVSPENEKHLVENDYDRLLQADGGMPGPATRHVVYEVLSAYGTCLARSIEPDLADVLKRFGNGEFPERIDGLSIEKAMFRGIQAIRFTSPERPDGLCIGLDSDWDGMGRNDKIVVFPGSTPSFAFEAKTGKPSGFNPIVNLTAMEQAYDFIQMLTRIPTAERTMSR